MRFSEALQGFKFHLYASAYSNETADLYNTYLMLLQDRLGDPDIASITSSQLVEFMGWLASEYTPKRKGSRTGPVRPSTLSNTWAAIRSLFKWHNQQFGNCRPDLALSRPKYRYDQVEPFTKEECSRLVKAAREVIVDPKDGKASYTMHRGTAERNVAIVLTLLDTGLRVGELTRLRVEDLNLVNGELVVRPYGSGQKTAGRHVYLGKASRNAVWKYLAKRKEQDDLRPADPLFATVDGKHFDRHGIASLLTRIGKRACVNGVHPHRTRHTFAITYLRNGGDPYTLQRLLGHSDMEMTKRYLAIAKGDSEEATRKFGVVDSWQL